jgi:hypothetical protein
MESAFGVMHVAPVQGSVILRLSISSISDTAFFLRCQQLLENEYFTRVWQAVMDHLPTAEVNRSKAEEFPYYWIDGKEYDRLGFFGYLERHGLDETFSL